MKKEDIEKLEKVIKLYKDIEKILDEVVESTKNDEDIVIPDVNGVLRSISVYLGISLSDAALNRLWIEHDLRYIKSGMDGQRAVRLCGETTERTKEKEC